jgi:flagellar assembly factor FliW
MMIATTRFGPVEADSADVIHFPEGLLGLPACRDWVLLADLQNDSLAWMQSTERPEIALCVVSPRRFVGSYQMRVARRELEPLRLDVATSAEVLVVVSRTERSITLNLKAPLVINLKERLGRQVVTNGDLPVQYVIGGVAPALKKIA